MTLAYNQERKRFEFRCGPEEKTPGGALGRFLASKAGLTAQWIGRVGTADRQLIWITGSTVRASQLVQFAAPQLRDQLRVAVQKLPLPVLSFNYGVYIWTGPMEGYLDGALVNYKDLFPKKAQFTFTREPSGEIPGWQGADQPVWWSANVDAALHCARFADSAAKEAMQKRGSTIALSRALTHDIAIPCPDGQEYDGYQKAGVAYAVDRFQNPHIRGVLFGDEMGLGKTIESLGVINYLNSNGSGGLKRILVVCPASLKRNWQRELEKWLVRPMTIGMTDAAKSVKVPATDIVIANYEQLGRSVEGAPTYDPKKKKVVKTRAHYLQHSLQIQWDLVIVDECHRLKNEDTIRTKLTLALQSKRWLMLSGTPLVNRPRELWTIAHHLAPQVFPNKWQFLRRYCAGGSFFDEYGGAQHLEELQEKMRTHFMIRRLKRDVLTELPAKRRQIIELPADGCKAMVQQELRQWDAREDEMSILRLKVEIAKASDNPEDYRRAVKALRVTLNVRFEELSAIRRDTAIAKIPMVTDHVAEALSEGNKVLLFTHHKEPAYKIAYAFPNETVMITGDTSLRDRDRAEHAFNNDGATRLLIGTIGAAGVGLNLQKACSHAVFAELDWVPGNVTQAEDRIHRKGQRDGVLIQHLVLEGSLDARMAQVLVEKQEIADKTLDAPTATELDYAMPDEMSTRSARPEDIARAAEKMSVKDIGDVHVLLRGMVNSSLDGTLVYADRPLAAFIADQKKLSPRMAALGKRLLSRYRSQLAAYSETQRLFKETK